MARYNCNNGYSYNNNYNYSGDCSDSYGANGYSYSRYGTYSNRLANPGMELPLDAESGFRNWETSGGVERTSKNSLVHSGNYAVMLNEGASMSQTLFRINPSRQYEFSFFAKFGSKKDEEKEDKKDSDKDSDGDSKSEKKRPDHKDDLGLKATVTFVTRNSKYDATEINVPAGSIGDNYVYYRTITPVAPPDAIAAIVRFNASEPQVRPHVPHHLGILVDDVSFSRH